MNEPSVISRKEKIINFVGTSPESFGRFTLLQKLSLSEFTEIWLAADPKGKRYALRRLNPEHRLSPSARHRFWRTCETVAHLNESVFFPAYLEHDRIDGQLYLAMEYVEGHSLAALIARQDPLLTDKLPQLLIEMASALGYVHGSGFAHLDFRPANILVASSGNVILVDFDQAQPISAEAFASHHRRGTAAYLAPEQLQARHVDPRTDIFAYGVAAYELLTGQQPFLGETVAEILAAHYDPALPVPIEAYKPGVAPALQRIVSRCLALDPAARYQFISVLLHDLQEAFSNQPFEVH